MDYNAIADMEERAGIGVCCLLDGRISLRRLTLILLKPGLKWEDRVLIYALYRESKKDKTSRQ